MELQTAIYACGAAALSNALAAVGYTLPQEAVAHLAETAGGGTGARGLLRAARQLGARAESFDDDRVARAWRHLRGALVDGAACVLLFDAGEHWVTAIGTLGEDVVVVDPAASVRNMVSTFGRDELWVPWRCPRKLHPKYFYAIAIARP